MSLPDALLSSYITRLPISQDSVVSERKENMEKIFRVGNQVSKSEM